MASMAPVCLPSINHPSLGFEIEQEQVINLIETQLNISQ